MNIIRSASELQPRPARVCLAIGMFDGVHLGHQQVIRQMIEDARQHEAHAVVVTFDRHPATIVSPARAPKLIYPLEKKLQVIASLGAQTVWLIHFDRPFSEQSGEAFVHGLVQGFGQVQSLCVGSRFAFGHKRSGNVELLRTLGKELGFVVHGLADVSLGGTAVSSTRIRAAICAGDLDAASQMLGRAYSLSGPVQRGDQLGRQLGFPTANLVVSELELPPHGVYAVHAEVAGQVHRAVLNIGLRPTLRQPEPRLQVEAHLLQFKGDLYGQEMEVTFVEKLREEQRFASPEDLRQQIARDIAAAEKLFQ